MLSEVGETELNYRSAACINALISSGNINYSRTCACISEGFNDLPSYIYQYYDTMCSNLWSSMSKYLELKRPIPLSLTSNYPNLNEVYSECEGLVRSMSSDIDIIDSFLAVDVFRVKAPYHFLVNLQAINMNTAKYSYMMNTYSDISTLVRTNIDNYSKLSESLTLSDLYGMILEVRNEQASLENAINANVHALDLKIQVLDSKTEEVTHDLNKTASYLDTSIAVLKNETTYRDGKLESEQATLKTTILNTIDSLVLLANTYNRHIAMYEEQMNNLYSAFQVLVDRDSYLAELIAGISQTQSSQGNIISDILDNVDDLLDFMDDVEDVFDDLVDLIP